MASIAKRKTRSAYQRIPGTAYDGSAARRLERAEVLEPRPRVRPRERAVSSPGYRYGRPDVSPSLRWSVLRRWPCLPCCF